MTKYAFELLAVENKTSCILYLDSISIINEKLIV